MGGSAHEGAESGREDGICGRENEAGIGAAGVKRGARGRDAS